MATDGASPACARKHPKHVSSAMEVLSIVGYEQPITRAENSNIRATDSSGVIETLRSRKLIEADPRFGSRGRPSFLATTADFLRSLGLGSLAELPPRPVPPAIGSASASNSDRGAIGTESSSLGLCSIIVSEVEEKVMLRRWDKAQFGGEVGWRA